MRKMQQSRRRQLLHGAEIKVVGVKRKVHNIEVGCSKLWTI